MVVPNLQIIIPKMEGLVYSSRSREGKYDMHAVMKAVGQPRKFPFKEEKYMHP